MAPSTTLRRLLKEVSELSPGTPSPNPTFHAAPLSDSDLHEWHFTLLGPPAPSPYAGGLYHGRISLPTQYPLKPPNFRFLTPSGRFEVNREICLSISGFHEETWMPAWGVRTALTALRSFMAEKGTAGQVGGLESSDEVRRRLADESRTWRCNDCGKTNDEVMREWWSYCKEAGVKVDEKGGMELEVVPEGFEMRDKGKEKEVEKNKEATATADDLSTTEPSRSISETKSEVVQTLSQPTTQQSIPPNSPIPSNTQGSLQPQTVRSKDTELSPTSNTTTQSRRTPLAPVPSDQRPTPTIQLPPTNPQSPLPSSQVPGQTQIQAQQDTITLDRAITGVFLALCFMILKKIFFPASTTAFGADELGMVREY